MFLIKLLILSLCFPPQSRELKNVLIGSTRQKQSLVQQGLAVPKLIKLLSPESPFPGVSSDLPIHAVYTLGSLAKGQDFQTKVLLDHGIVPVLLHGLLSPNPKLVEGCLCCLKTLFQHSSDAPVHIVYSDPTFVPHLLGLMQHSTANKISGATILMHACKVCKFWIISTSNENIFLVRTPKYVHLRILFCSTNLV